MALVENLKLQSEALGINVEEMDDYAASLKSSAKNSDRLADSLAEDQAALHQVAQYAMRLNKGV
jgi:hypothetical protein